MKENRKLKFTNELKKIGPKLKWFLFTEMQDLKLTSDYIDFICPTSSKKSTPDSNPIEELEEMVKKALIREFSPEIQKSKSFDLLVDSVMHNIQKKSLKNDLNYEEDSDLDFED